MKRRIFLSVILFVSVFTINAQNDTMYIMKNGAIVGQYNVNTGVDSIIFYRPTLSNPTTGSFTDSRDSTVYSWVRIGNQVWMAENLKYLPSVLVPDTGSKTTPFYYVYDYNGTIIADAKAKANYTTYGVLYNWYAAMNGAKSSYTNPSNVQGVCPKGWHLPSDPEWTELTDYLGGDSIVGGKLKDTTLWESPNTGATNETGFSALPGGCRTDLGIFSNIDSDGYWWSTTEFVYNLVWGRTLYYASSHVSTSIDNMKYSFSVRCVRD